MSITLFRTTIKKNIFLLLIFFGVLTMYTTIIISMYNPDDIESFTSMMEMFPEEMMKAFGFDSAITDLTAYLASWLYGMLMFAFPMVYCIVLGNRLIAKTVDNGSMAYLLSTPNSRIRIVTTQALYAFLSIFVLFAALFGVGVMVSEAYFPGLMDIGAYFKLNLITMLVNLTVMAITSFFSCLFNDSKYSLGFGAGIPIMFMLMNMLGGASEDAQILKDLSIYGLYDPVELVHGVDVSGAAILYIVSIIVLSVSGILIFKKKRLPL